MLPRGHPRWPEMPSKALLSEGLPRSGVITRLLSSRSAAGGRIGCMDRRSAWSRGPDTADLHPYADLGHVHGVPQPRLVSPNRLHGGGDMGDAGGVLDGEVRLSSRTFQRHQLSLCPFSRLVTHGHSQHTSARPCTRASNPDLNHTPSAQICLLEGTSCGLRTHRDAVARGSSRSGRAR